MNEMDLDDTQSVSRLSLRTKREIHQYERGKSSQVDLIVVLKLMIIGEFFVENNFFVWLH